MVMASDRSHDLEVAPAGPAQAAVGESASAKDRAAIGRIEMALQHEPARRRPPVEDWDPPACGDIGMMIARDGRWLFRGSPILRPELVRLFASILRREADGRHVLVTPVEKVDVMVEDAPFLGVEIELLGDGEDQTLVVRTNVDDVVRVSAEHPLRFETTADGGLKPYVRVRGRLEALLTRAVTYELAELIVSKCGGDGNQAAGSQRDGIWSEGCFFPLDATTSAGCGG